MNDSFYLSITDRNGRTSKSVIDLSTMFMFDSNMEKKEESVIKANAIDPIMGAYNLDSVDGLNILSFSIIIIHSN